MNLSRRELFGTVVAAVPMLALSNRSTTILQVTAAVILLIDENGGWNKNLYGQIDSTLHKLNKVIHYNHYRFALEIIDTWKENPLKCVDELWYQDSFTRIQIAGQIIRKQLYIEKDESAYISVEQRIDQYLQKL